MIGMNWKKIKVALTVLFVACLVTPSMGESRHESPSPNPPISSEQDAYLLFNFVFLENQGPWADIGTFQIPSSIWADKLNLTVEVYHCLGLDPPRDTKYEMHWCFRWCSSVPGIPSKCWERDTESWYHGDDFKDGDEGRETFEFEFDIKKGAMGGYFIAQCSLIVYIYKWDYDLDRWCLQKSLVDRDEKTQLIIVSSPVDTSRLSVEETLPSTVFRSDFLISKLFSIFYSVVQQISKIGVAFYQNILPLNLTSAHPAEVQSSVWHLLKKLCAVILN